MAYQGDIEEVDPYDCNNEPHPDNVVFSNEFKELTAVMSQARSMLLDPLRSSDYTNAILGGLVKEVEKRTRVDSSSQNEVMFAISGDMASGWFLNLAMLSSEDFGPDATQGKAR